VKEANVFSTSGAHILIFGFRPGGSRRQHEFIATPGTDDDWERRKSLVARTEWSRSARDDLDGVFGASLFTRSALDAVLGRELDAAYGVLGVEVEGASRAHRGADIVVSAGLRDRGPWKKLRGNASAGDPRKSSYDSQETLALWDKARRLRMTD
jgi:hypothetical protein